LACKILFYLLEFQFIKERVGQLVSTHFTAWGCSQPLPIPAMVFCLLNFIFSLEFQSIKQLVGQLVSTHFIALGFFTSTTDTGNGIWLVKLFFPT
jgi:hypothetical protein